MRKLKDFIYDFNDVLVALVIVVVAAIILLWRVSVVMDYNGYLTGQRTSLKDKIFDISFDGIDLKKENVEAIVEVEDSVLTDSAAVATQPAVISQPAIVSDPAIISEPVVETKPAVAKPVKEVKSYSLEVSKEKATNTWQAVGSLLEKNGIIESKSAFISRVVERKVDSQLQLGKFEFTNDLKLDEVIDILIN